MSTGEDKSPARKPTPRATMARMATKRERELLMVRKIDFP